MSESSSQFRCLVVDKDEQKVNCEFQTRETSELGEGSTTVRISHSSLNYKDGLACAGHPGVAKSLPLVPGIDAAGAVVESANSQFQPEAPVMIFHADFGTKVDGGYAELVRVPDDWVYPIPSPLTAESTMILGTAGFTAAQCVDQLIRHDIRPDSGPIAVSGATGGVGIFAVKLLAKLGYEIIASTGKKDRVDWLKANGATTVVSREEFQDVSAKPLLKGYLAGAVDTVGSNTLSTIIRSTKIGGCVTACGLAGGFDLPISVYPFILRGVTLQGVDTANIPVAYRSELWNRLAGEWRMEGLDDLKEVIGFDQLPEQAEKILAGKVAGRTLVEIG